MDLAQVFAGIEAVFVDVTPAFLADPGDHPNSPLVGINTDTGDFLLTTGRLEGEGTFEFQRVCVVDGDLNVLADAVHGSSQR